MAEISSSDIEQLWKEIGEHSWNGLRQALQQHRHRSDGLSGHLVEMMLQETQSMENSNQPFPSSFQQLTRIFSQRLNS